MQIEGFLDGLIEPSRFNHRVIVWPFTHNNRQAAMPMGGGSGGGGGGGGHRHVDSKDFHHHHHPLHRGKKSNDNVKRWGTGNGLYIRVDTPIPSSTRSAPNARPFSPDSNERIV